MSDRPMRLKYLTKMKIILCIFLLCITAVSVFGQSVELNGILGESVKFPAAVKIDGNLMYSGVRIGDVTSGRFKPAPDVKYSDRLHWDSSTGLFSLSELKMEDSGEYTVQNTQQNINTVFQLNLYKDNVPVSKPHLSVTRNEYRCTVLCAAVRGTEVTLTLYKNGEKKPYVTSPGHSHPHLDMTVPVESGTYTCEAKNSVSRNTSDPLTVGAHCTGSSAGTIAAIIIAVVAVAIVALIAVVFVFLYRREKWQAVIRDDIRRLILVKKLLDKIVATAPESKTSIDDALRKAIEVHEISEVVVAPAHVHEISEVVVAPAHESKTSIDDEIQTSIDDGEKQQAFVYYAFTSLILVQEISEDIFAPAHVKEMQALHSKVKTFLDFLVAPASVHEISEVVVAPAHDIRSDRRALRKAIEDGDEQAVFLHDIRCLIIDIRSLILDIRSKVPVWGSISFPNALKTKTSSHPTEVPLNQATPEVEE